MIAHVALSQQFPHNASPSELVEPVLFQHGNTYTLQDEKARKAFTHSEDKPTKPVSKSILFLHT